MAEEGGLVTAPGITTEVTTGITTLTTDATTERIVARPPDPIALAKGKSDERSEERQSTQSKPLTDRHCAGSVSGLSASPSYSKALRIR
jgi:hypothetical protein